MSKMTEEERRKKELYEASPQYVSDLMTRYDKGDKFTDAESNKIKHEKYIASPKYRDDLMNEYLDSKSPQGKIKGYDYEKGYQTPEITSSNRQGFDADYRSTLRRDVDARSSAPYNTSVAPEVKGKRSALDRLFDALQIGGYAVQGGLSKQIDRANSNDTETKVGDLVGDFFSGAWEGIKAGNPFGSGHEEGEYHFSDNLGKLGWNPTGKAGKVGKSIAGIAGDILLDPLTYINPVGAGGNAIFKGTGKMVGKEVVEKFTGEMAEKVLRQSGKGVAPEAKAVEDLVRRVNKARGIIEEGSSTGFGLYGSKVPFANKLGIADKQIELISEAKLRTFGDATFAPYVNKLRDNILHSKVGKLFSTKADLLDLARKDPTGLAMGYDFARKAGKANLTYKEAMVTLKDEYSKIKGLTPENQKAITNMLEDESLWKKMTTYKSTSEIKEFNDLHAEVQSFVDKYGMENKHMQKIVGEITPRFKAGEKVTMRFPGMQDAEVAIEGMSSIVNGTKYYKIKGFKNNIPETAFKSADDLVAERLTVARTNHMPKVEANVEAGHTGRINASNSAMGVDAKGLPLSKELDDAIASGEIPVVRDMKKDSKNDPYKGYVPSEIEMADNVPYVDKFDNNMSKRESQWLKENDISKSMDEIATAESETMPREVIKSEPKYNKTVDEANVNARAKVVGDSSSDALYVNGSLNTSSRRIVLDEKGQIKAIRGAEFKNGRWVEKKSKPLIQSQSSLKWKQKREGGSHEDFKRFITDKIRVNEEGMIVKEGKVIGNARNLTKKTTLANLTGIKGLNKNAWNKIAGNEAQEASFFERLLTEEPAVKEMFDGLMKSGQMTMRKKDIRTFMDSYFNNLYHKPADLVHIFHNDHAIINKMLEGEFGSFDKVKAMGDKARELKASGLRWDGEGIKPDAKIEVDRMTRQYEIMNDPEAIAQFDKAQRASLDERAYDGIGGTRNDVAEADARMRADKSSDKATLDYVNADNNIQALTDQKVEYVVMKDGKFRAKVEEVGDGEHVWYKAVDAKPVQISKTELKAKGFTWFEAKQNTSVTGIGSIQKDTTKFSNIGKGGEGIEILDDITGGLDNYNELDETVATVFKGKDTKSVNMISTPKDPSDMKLTKVKTEVKDGKVVEVGTGREIDDTVNKAVESNPVRETISDADKAIKEANTQWVIDDEQNLALISETITQMEGKEVQGAYKTIEQALSELPKDIEHIIAKEEMDKASASLLEQKLTTYRQALTTQTEFESFAKTLWGDTAYKELRANHVTTIRAIDKPEWQDLDITKTAESIHKEFKSIAEMEKAIGQLDNVMLEGYVYHAVNPLFESPLAQFTQQELDDMGIKIPKNKFVDRGYKKGSVMANGYVLKKGTIEEINDNALAFGKQINDALIAKGKDPIAIHKMFQEEISDIYLARMQGHYKLMYDDAVFGDMSRKFGKKFEGVVEEGSSLTVSTEQLRKSLKGLDPQAKEKILKDYKLTQDGFNKLGNSFIRVDEDVANNIIRNGHAEVHQINNVILDKAEKLAHVQMATDTHGLLGAYDKFLRAYKLMVTAYRPAFHFNNMKGNAFNNYLDVGTKAMSPRFNKAGIEMAIGKNLDTVIELGGKSYTYKEIVEEMTIQGKIGNGFFGTDIKKVLEKEVTDGKPSLAKRAFNKPTEFGSKVEDQGKIVNFIANLDAGKSFTEAGEHVDKFLFDYGDLTKFESETMKRLIPFYTWIRKNAPLQLEQMLLKPQRYAPIAKALGEIEHMTDENGRIDKSKLPSFAKDWTQLPFNITGDSGNEEVLMWSNNLPYMDVNKIPNIFDLKDSLGNIFQSSSPAIRMPIELGMNKNFFFDRPIDNGRKVVDPSGKFEVSPQLAYILAQIPQYAEPAGVVKKKGVDRLIHILDKGGASGVKSYDAKGNAEASGYGGTYMKNDSTETNADYVNPEQITKDVKGLWEE
jgi:hypothetical protein